MAKAKRGRANVRGLQAKAQEQERELARLLKHLEHLHAQSALEHRKQRLESRRAHELSQDGNTNQTTAKLKKVVELREESLKRVKVQVKQAEEGLKFIAASTPLGVCTLSSGQTSTCTQLSCDGTAGCTNWH
jgi:hypothetical protein